MVALGLLGALLLLTGRTGATDTYYAVYDNVAGVKFGTSVRFEGYEIGQVETVEPVTADGRTRFRVTLAVQSGFPIPRESEASVASAGLLAGSAISITRGQSSDVLDPGTELATAPSRSITNAVSNLAGTVGKLSAKGVQPLMTKLNRAADQLDTLLNGPVPRIARNLENASGSLAGVSGGLDETIASPQSLKRIERTLTRMESAATKLDKRLLSDANAERFSGTLENLQQFSSDATGLTRQLRNTGKRVNSLVAKLDRLTKNNESAIDASISDMRYSLSTIARRIDTITYNLEGTSRNMHEFARQLRRNPSLLLRGGSPAEAAE